MCIAIYKPAGKTITEETLRNCFDNNSDGCGFAYINEDHMGVRRIKIKKSLDFENFYRMYKRAIRISPESPFLIHFRIKTHGPVNIENCHPFRIDHNHVFIHNGIIKGMVYDKDRSDTNRFNMDYLQSLPEGWMGSEGVLKMISHMVDLGKIVVMNIDGDIQICNESKGKWVDGIWFSNTSYEKRTTTYYYSDYSSYNTGNTTGHKYQGTKSYTTTGRKASRFVGTGLKTTGSMESCCGCNRYFVISEMDAFYDDDRSAAIYCGKCSKRVQKEFLDMKDLKISSECYVDYFNEYRGAEEDDKYYPIVGEWDNPWEMEGPEDDKDLTTTEEDMAEYYENQEDFDSTLAQTTFH